MRNRLSRIHARHVPDRRQSLIACNVLSTVRLRRWSTHGHRPASVPHRNNFHSDRQSLPVAARHATLQRGALGPKKYRWLGRGVQQVGSHPPDWIGCLPDPRGIRWDCIQISGSSALQGRVLSSLAEPSIGHRRLSHARRARVSGPLASSHARRSSDRAATSGTEPPIPTRSWRCRLGAWQIARVDPSLGHRERGGMTRSGCGIECGLYSSGRSNRPCAFQGPPG